MDNQDKAIRSALYVAKTYRLSAAGGRIGRADGGRATNPLGMYSKASEVARSLPMAKANGQQMIAMLADPKRGVKKDELVNAGLLTREGKVHPDWAGRPVSKDELAQHLEGVLPQVQETTLKKDYSYPYRTAEEWQRAIDRENGRRNWPEAERIGAAWEEFELGTSPSGDSPKFEKYTLPEGSNYREVLLHTPKGNGKTFRSSHWDEPNVVAHLRMKDRTGTNGEKVLHVEEIQSDWGQEGRDKGFKDQVKNNLSVKNEGGIWRVRNPSGELVELNRAVGFSTEDQARQAIANNVRDVPGLPSGPYVTSTEGWTDLALKRALQEAVKGGYDKLVVSPGQANADHYGLEKNFSKIVYHPKFNELTVWPHNQEFYLIEGVMPENLSNHVGNELSKKLLSTQQEGDGYHILEGDELRTGGEGMRKFYDRDVPQRLNKLASGMDPDAKVNMFSHPLPAKEDAPSGANGYMGHSLDITDKMRDAVNQGLPAFKRGGEVPHMADGGTEYADPETKTIQDWQWKPLGDVQAKLGGMTEIPSHVLEFGNFMDKTAQRAATQGLTPRDLIKAYTITRASIQRQAINSDKLREAGFDLPPSITGKIRPEGAFGEWLHSPAGQAYLEAAQKGQQHEAAIQNAAQVMKPFGKDNDLIDALRWAAQNLPGKEGQVSQLVAAGREKASTPDEWRQFTKNIRGIGPSKSGFVASLMGRGDQPTLDARQIILHTGNPAKEASKFVSRKGGIGGAEAVDRLASRQQAMNLSLPDELSPYYQHLAHHAVWDKAGNEETTHEDVMRAMQHAATGGAIDGNHISNHPIAIVMDSLGFPGLKRYESVNRANTQRLSAIKDGSEVPVSKAMELTRRKKAASSSLGLAKKLIT